MLKKNDLINAMLIAYLSLACGRRSSNSEGGLGHIQSSQEGSYRVVLETVNPGVMGNKATGAVRLNITKHDLNVSLKLIGSPVNTFHMQHIRGAAPCPNMSNDFNGDGFVDIHESFKGDKGVLIPLDADLKSQLAGKDNNPRSDGTGRYSYTEQAERDEILIDLRSQDEDPEDHLIKLNPDEQLNLSGRTLIILGVPARTTLPETVAPLASFSAQASLPIACGKIIKIAEE